MANKATRIDFCFENMEYAMQQKNITKSTICKVVDCSVKNYASWKRQRRITEKDIMKIAEFLNVDLDWLISGKNYSKTKEPPKDRDYIRDQEGYIVKPYKNGKSAYELVKKNKTRSELFLEWIHSEPIYDFVNKYLLDQGKEPIQKKVFDKYMEMFEVILDGEMFGLLVKHIGDDILLMRERIPGYDQYLKNKK